MDDLKHIYQNKLDKALYAHDAKDLGKRTISDKVLNHGAYEITLNPKYDGYQKGLAILVYSFLDKKTRS